jgi:hypothetical protein
MPKSNRGLLTYEKKRLSPGPASYLNEIQSINLRIKDATFAMPRANRDIPF